MRTPFFQAQLPHPAELLLRPHPAAGVVGGAQEEEGGPGVLYLLLEVGKVNFIAVGAFHQTVFHRDAVGAANLVVEGTVDRGLEQHLVPLVGHELDEEAQGGDDAAAVEHVPGIDVPAEAMPVPAADAAEELPGEVGAVAEDLPVHPLVEGFHYAVGAGEVHVRHPEGKGAGLRMAVLHRHKFPFGAVCAMPVNRLVEIVGHRFSSLFSDKTV